MSGSYLLDTNIAIAILEKEIDLTSRQGGTFFLCSHVVGELFFGAAKSQRSEANAGRVERLAAVCPVLGCDVETARQYGTVKNELRRKGRPIPENDIWIAATALQHGLILVTRDPHFNEVESLPTVVW